MVSHVQLFATPWTVALQAPLSVDFSRQEYWLCVHAQSHPTPGNPIYYSPPGPLSMGFSRQGYWNVLPFPSPEDLPNPRIESTPPGSPVLAGRYFTTESPGQLLYDLRLCLSFSSIQFSCSVMSDSLRPHESQHARPSCPSPTPGVHSDSGPSSP